MFYKMVILVREDLNMSPGKVAAQTAHAGLIWLAERGNKPNLTYEEEMWLYGSPYRHSCFGEMKKIILSIENYEQMREIEDMARDSGLIVHKVFDEGVRAYTCLAIGPNYERRIDDIVGHLKLYGNAPKNIKLSDVKYSSKGLFFNSIYWIILTAIFVWGIMYKLYH